MLKWWELDGILIPCGTKFLPRFNLVGWRFSSVSFCILRKLIFAIMKGLVFLARWVLILRFSESRV